MTSMDDDKKVRAMLRALSDESLTLSDDEIEAEVRAQGRDPNQVASSMRSRAQEIIRAAAKARMAKAQAGYAGVAKRKVAGWLSKLTPEKLREVVKNALTQPTVPQQLTLQWREGKTPSDDDIRSLAYDLAELGLLTKPGSDSSDDA